MSTTRETKPGALALAVLTDGLRYETEDDFKSADAPGADAFTEAIADLRALMEQRDNYYAQIEQQADRAERAEAAIVVAHENNEALRADVARLREALADATRWIESLPADLALGSIMPDKLRAALAATAPEGGAS